jgi:hypothetical protein
VENGVEDIRRIIKESREVIADREAKKQERNRYSGPRMR